MVEQVGEFGEMVEFSVQITLTVKHDFIDLDQAGITTLVEGLNKLGCTVNVTIQDKQSEGGEAT